ncbi:MAG: glutamate--tRNA ligase family protein, partial [Desulfuromonadales bacterium]|nr:glutamate--tRNA ligase family protein [Desulfuromonadales bacterium]
MGNARTALFNWLFARRYGGDFILRIEDTDQERTKEIYIRNLLADLSWLGLDWDEGPGKEGVAGPYHQSRRSDFYLAHLESLKGNNRVYPCYCTEEELEAERKALQEKRMMPRYLGRCRELSGEERSRLEGEGRRPAYRFRVNEGTAQFEDLIRGQMKFDCRGIGDFIIFRSNGLPAYNFAVVIDDHLMGITHVIRGEDHLSNTAAQILLYQALDFSPPVFAHHALIVGKDHA